MKVILSLFFVFHFVPTFCQALIDNDGVNEEGTRTISTKAIVQATPAATDYLDAGNELLFALSYSKDKKGLEFWLFYFVVSTAKDLGCLSDSDGKLVVTFTDDSVVTMTQASDTDCTNSYVAAYVAVTREETNSPAFLEIVNRNMEKLMAATIKKIVVYATNGNMEYEVKPDKRDIFSQHIKTIRAKL